MADSWNIEALEDVLSHADPTRWATLSDIESAKVWEREVLTALGCPENVSEKRNTEENGR